MSKRAFLIPLLFYSSFFSAQNPDDLTGSWTEIIGQHQLSEKWCLGTTAISQHHRFFNDFQFVLLRTGIAYRFSGTALAAIGYDYFYSEAYSEDRFKLQHRAWQEFNLSSKYWEFRTSHRYRFESIWSRQEPQYDLSHRFRYRFKVEHQLYKSIYVSAFDEIFLNTGQPYFNQNRLAIGFGYHISEDLRMELGYLKIHFDEAHYDRIRLALFFKTDLSSGNRN
jgi:long-subunit fatty acid transport protein